MGSYEGAVGIRRPRAILPGIEACLGKFGSQDGSRKGYLNYVGAQLGVQGALRRNEANHVYDFDQYLQAQWDPAERWRLVAGVRNSLVEVSSHGHLAVLDDADSEVRYSAVNPVAGVTYRASSAIKQRSIFLLTLREIGY